MLAESFDWELIRNAGPVAIVAIALTVLFLRHLGEVRREYLKSLTDITEKFGERLDDSAEKTRLVVEEQVASNYRVETALRDLSLEIRTAHRPPVAP